MLVVAPDAANTIPPNPIPCKLTLFCCRVLLLFDVWHPDVTKEERKSIEEMFEYSQKMGWMSK